MRFNFLVCCCVAAAGASTNSASAFECNASVHNVLIYSDGSVNVLHSGRGDYTVVCGLRGDRGGVDAVTCAAWTGLLQQVKKKGGTANFYYPGAGSCSTMPTYWSSPVPTYIGDVTP